MATTPVSSATTTTPVITAADRGMGSLKSEDFFKMLVTELKQQDPLQPAKTSDMIGEISQIRGIELSKQLTDTLSQLSKQQHTSGASELLGKYVTATMKDDAGAEQEVSGVVTGVRFDPDGSAVLELDTGDSILAGNVTRITSVDTAKAAAATTTKAKTATATNTGTTTATTTATNVSQTAQPSSSPAPSLLTLNTGIHL